MSLSRTSRKKSFIAAAILATLPTSSLLAQTSGTWANVTGGTWSDPLNWSSNPNFPDGGGTATFLSVTDQQAGSAITSDPASVSLSSIVMNTPYVYAIQRPTGNTSNLIAMASGGTLNIIASPIATPTAFLSTGHQINIAIDGAATVYKEGAGILTLAPGNIVSNSYAGGTVVNGGVLRIASGDFTLGVSGTSLSVNNANFRASGTAMTSSRPFNLTGTAVFEAFAGIDTSGVVSGVGANLVKSPLAGGALTLRSANSYSGYTAVGAGVLSLPASGSILNTSLIRLTGGTLSLDNTSTNIADRVPDSALITLGGGGIQFIANNFASSSESVGAVTLSRGLNAMTAEPKNNANASLTATSITRDASNRGVLFFRGNSLGAAPAVNVGNIMVTGGITTVGGGGADGTTNISIIPWAYGNLSNTGTFTEAVGTTSLVTYGANGVRPLNPATEYAAVIAGDTNDNVRLSAAADVSTDAGINALLVTTGGSVTGSAKLTVKSGLILNQVTSTISPNLDFGTREGILLTNGAATFSGVVSGTGGLTKAGVASGTLASASNTYTGETVINGARLIYTNGNLTDTGVPSALGQSTSAIRIAPGSNLVAALWWGGTGVSTIDRDVVVDGNSLSESLPTGGLGTAGTVASQQLIMNGDITVNNAILRMEADPSPIMTINGKISGNGRVADAFGSAQILNGANDYTGGTEILQGTYLLGNDSALGTGTIWFTNNATVPSAANPFPGAIGATGGARTISNNVIMQTPNNTAGPDPTFLGTIFTGDSPLTLSGSINLAGATRLISITGATPQTITFAGVVGGGGIFKQGAGTLVLSGDNSFPGITAVDAGVMVLKHSNALGAAFSTTNFVQNNGVLEIDGSAGDLTIGNEDFIINTLLSAAPNGTIRNTAGNNSIGGGLFVNAGDHGIFVAPGSSLTAAGLRDNSGSLNSAVLTKLGGGQLTVDRLRLSVANLNAGTIRLTGSGTLGQGKTVDLNIATGATLDLGNTGMIVTNTPAATLKAKIVEGRNGGAWNGTGIRSSSAVTSGNKTGLGYTDGASVVDPNSVAGEYQGQTVTGTDTIIAHVYLGDANLDRKVDSLDFAATLGNAANYGLTSGAEWKQGDFNYDSKVNTEDFNELAGNFGLTLAAPLPSAGLDLISELPLATQMGLQREIAEGDLRNVTLLGDEPKAGFASQPLGTVVPEPASLSLLLAGLTLARRRR